MKQRVDELPDLDADFDPIAFIGGGESRGRHGYTGTKALMLAVLEDGIRSYLIAKGRVRTEAEHWVQTAWRRSPFSFVVVCETLGLEPDAVRIALARMRAGTIPLTEILGRTRPNVQRTRRLGS